MSVGGDVRNYLTKVGKQGNRALGFLFTNNITADKISPIILRNHVFSYLKNRVCANLTGFYILVFNFVKFVFYSHFCMVVLKTFLFKDKRLPHKQENKFN